MNMKIKDRLTFEEIKLLCEIGIEIEDRDYSAQEIGAIRLDILDVCSALDGNDSNKYETLQEQFFDWKSVQIYREGVLKLEATLETYKHPGRRHAGYLNDRMRSANEAARGVGPVSKQMSIEHRRDGRKEIISYLLILGKRWNYGVGEGHILYPLEKRVYDFNEFFKLGLMKNQSLKYEHEAFCIVAETYEIHYYIEAYRKQPDKKCFMENDKSQVLPLKRTGAARAFYDLKKTDGVGAEDLEWVFRMMNDADLAAETPNAAARFAQLYAERRKRYGT